MKANQVQKQSAATERTLELELEGLPTCDEEDFKLSDCPKLCKGAELSSQHVSSMLTNYLALSYLVFAVAQGVGTTLISGTLLPEKGVIL